jgi:hypothetical protein
MIHAPVFKGLDWLVHGFGLRDSVYPAEIRLLRQIHSNLVFDEAECGEAVMDGDALICRRSGVVVGVKTADCVPILLADPVTRTVAAVHAGWRGTAEDIVAATIRAMGDKWGVKSRNLRAAIGPSIGPCCYEVGPEVAARFGVTQVGTNEPKTIHLDLPTRNEEQLRANGVRDLWKSGECTRCAADRFFSFRREKERAGRMVSFIGRKNEAN